MRDISVVDGMVHTHEVVGSSPAPATISVTVGNKMQISTTGFSCRTETCV